MFMRCEAGLNGFEICWSALPLGEPFRSQAKPSLGSGSAGMVQMVGLPGLVCEEPCPRKLGDHADHVFRSHYVTRLLLPAASSHQASHPNASSGLPPASPGWRPSPPLEVLAHDSLTKVGVKDAGWPC